MFQVNSIIRKTLLWLRVEIPIIIVINALRYHTAANVVYKKLDRNKSNRLKCKLGDSEQVSAFPDLHNVMRQAGVSMHGVWVSVQMLTSLTLRSVAKCG